MAARATRGFFINHKLFCKFFYYAFIASFVVLGQATSAWSEDQPALEELKEHAATIDDILSEASLRVDKLVGEGATPAEFMDAIRQELTLSRRWNQHLTTILLEVAKAKQALARREREAAVEIKRMTAIAEEARLELVALKEVLNHRSENTRPKTDEQSDRRAPGTSFADSASSGSQVPANGNQVLEGVARGLAGPGADLRDAREMLKSMQSAQDSAVNDVDAIRSKLIEALQTLGDVGEQPVMVEGIGYGDLTSASITAWAASMATRLQKPLEEELD